ncbi:hypothetical protein ACFXDJ_28975 [Streptomyces sp. NPDC059443]|uniref:hypothetical protein n=1 Tax=unclassified Streptomyces TaxID=2593676 RepID=UPI0036C7E5E0
MTNQSDFGVPLGRLLDHRKLDAGSVATRAGIAESGLRAVLGSTAPEPELLRALAPALGLQTVDLFALAGVPLPEDLAPLDAQAGRLVPHLVSLAVSLPP